MVACSHCKEEVDNKNVTYRNGTGAGITPVIDAKRNRRPSDPAVLDRGRPSSVAQTLKVIGDRWSFMVIREAFFGVRHFDDLQNKLGIAPNILTDRLDRLVAEGIFVRRKYQDLPERYEYPLTEKGKDLVPPIAMLRWGDDWLARGKPPLILKHNECGHDFNPTVVLTIAASRCAHRISATASIIARAATAARANLEAGRRGYLHHRNAAAMRHY